MAHPVPETLYGRDEAVARLAGSGARLTVLSGASGVGKSAVLTAAQAATDNAIAPQPRTLPSSGGIVQRVFLEALADVIGEYAEAHPVADFGQKLAEVAERIGKHGEPGLARVIGRELLALLRGRIGEHVGEATAEYLATITDTVDERLAARLNSALDRGAAETVVSFASDVLEHLEPKRAVIALDAGERLSRDDVRVLCDVVETLPAGLRLRLAVSTYSAETRQIVKDLKTTGAGAVAEAALAGIDEAGVRAWLQAEGLSGDDAAEATRLTGGYALHMRDLIGHLRDGGNLSDQPLREGIGRLIDEAWDQLDNATAASARRLCVFADPLGFARTAAFLGVEQAEWGETQDRLVRGRLFAAEVNGEPWFHEQHRRHIRDRKLGESERGDACAAAVRLLRQLTFDTERPDRLPELAEALAQATPLLESDEQLDVVTTLSSAELALCAALVDLTRPRMTSKAVSSATLLRYARGSLASSGDLIPALDTLRHTSLLVVLEERQGTLSMVEPSFTSDLVILAIMGRARRDLGIAVVPYSAGLVFDTVVRPRLGAFVPASFGIGQPSLAATSNDAVETRRGGMGVIRSRRDAGPNLLLRARYGTRLYHGCAAFENAKARDAAFERLHQLRVRVFEQDFELTDVIPHPMRAVPCWRFLRAAALIIGSALRVSPNPDQITAERSLDSPVPLADRLRIRAETLATVRPMADAAERYAMELDEPIGFLYRDEDSASLVAEVVGGREGAEPLAFDPGPVGPFHLYRIEEGANLAHGERIARVMGHFGHDPGTKDPAVEALELLARRAAEFNETQEQIPVPLDPAALREMLCAALQCRLRDADALREGGIFAADPAAPRALSYDLLISRQPEEQALFSANLWNARLLVRGASDDENEVTVEVVDRPISGVSEAEAASPLLSRVQGDAQFLVAELLGHRASDIRLRS